VNETAPRLIHRRVFLARMGVLGAAVALGGSAFGRTVARAGSGPDVRLLLEELSRDTLSGLAAFVVPGPDPYSVAQGVSTAEDGALAARTPDFLMAALDRFFPVPDEALRPAVQALATGLGDVPLALPPGLLGVPVATVARLDEALAPVLAGDDTVPLSFLISLMLNQLATMADPTSLAGPFPSPFANLAYDRKAEAFRILEEDTTRVAAMLDAGAPEPMRQSWSGLLAFTAGALLEFAGFGAYCEWAVLDGHTLRDVPVGWRLTGAFAETGYRPVEGWADFKGYYQNRRSVHR
jgi:hypothetical protein